MSGHTRSDLRKKLQVYYDALYIAGNEYRKEKKVFHPIVTLTLPSTQMHTDKEIKREALMRFVEKLKYNFDVRFYYWVAEKQLNQNIHFHLLIDRFIDHKYVRDKWNERLDNMGYIRAFYDKHGHKNPNSTDIQAIKSLVHSSDYVTKYTSKVDQQGGIEGRLHGECDLLKECKRYKELEWSELREKLFFLVEKKILKVKRLEHCTIFEGDIRRIMAGHMPKTLKRWNEDRMTLVSRFYN
jgi:hypothetical protein